jgi:hypothetical protein
MLRRQPVRVLQVVGLEDTRQQLGHLYRLGHVGLLCMWPTTDVVLVAAEDRRGGEQVQERV